MGNIIPYSATRRWIERRRRRERMRRSERFVAPVSSAAALREQPDRGGLDRAYVAAAPNPFRAIGSDRTRMPVASKIAAPTAGAIAMIGVSPAPIDG